jgi:hypothetical protein
MEREFDTIKLQSLPVLVDPALILHASTLAEVSAISYLDNAAAAMAHLEANNLREDVSSAALSSQSSIDDGWRALRRRHPAALVHGSLPMHLLYFHEAHGECAHQCTNWTKSMRILTHFCHRLHLVTTRDGCARVERVACSMGDFRSAFDEAAGTGISGNAQQLRRFH